MNSGVRRALWKERVQQWRDSGLSQRAFARKHGWPVRQAGYWIRKLRDDVGAKAPELVPVVIKSGNVAEAAAAPAVVHGVGGWRATSRPATAPRGWPTCCGGWHEYGGGGAYRRGAGRHAPGRRRAVAVGAAGAGRRAMRRHRLHSATGAATGSNSCAGTAACGCASGGCPAISSGRKPATRCAS